MRAIFAEGGRLVMRSLPLPALKPTDVRIRVAYAGINRADLLQAAGKYPPPPGAPESLGLECSGFVDAVGSDVASLAHATRLSVGDRVCALLPGGGYATHCDVDAGSVVPVPDGLSLRDAAALPEVYCTVLQSFDDAKPPRCLLVHAGASGIGCAAIQLARSVGAVVVATASPSKHAALADLGVAKCLPRGPSFAADVLAASPGGAGADVIIDPVFGGGYLAEDARCVAADGVITILAFMGGTDFPPPDSGVCGRLLGRRVTLRFSSLRGQSLPYKAALCRRFAAAVLPHAAAGRIRPMVSGVEAFSEAGAAAAHATLAQGDQVGKVLLRVDGAE